MRIRAIAESLLGHQMQQAVELDGVATGDRLPEPTVGFADIPDEEEAVTGPSGVPEDPEHREFLGVETGQI